MPATTLAAIATPEQVFSGKYNITLGGIIKIIGIKRMAFAKAFKFFVFGAHAVSSLQVQEIFFSQQFLFGLAVTRVVNTAINRANGSTLGFIMKACTFGTFIGNDIV